MAQGRQKGNGFPTHRAPSNAAGLIDPLHPADRRADRHSKLLGGPIARPTGQIKGVSSYGIDIGQRLEVETAQGSGNVVGREAGVISIEN